MRPATWIAFLCGVACGAAIVALAPAFHESGREASARDAPAASTTSIAASEPTVASLPAETVVSMPEREKIADASPPHGTVRSEAKPRRTVAEIVASIRAAVDSADSDVRIDRMLVELLESGPDGPRLVVDLFVDPSFRPDEFSRAFGAVLAGIDDPRIAPAAQRWLEQNLSEGDDDWTYTQSFLRLIAAKGSGTELTSLVAALSRTGQVGHHAAEAVALLGSGGVDPAPYLEKFQELANSDRTRHTAGTLASALAQWGDPRVDDRLWTLALDLSVGPGVLGEALSDVARKRGDAALDRFQREFAQAPIERRCELVPALFGYAQSGDGTTESGRRRFENEVLRLFESGGSVAVACAGQLRGFSGELSPVLLQAVERLRSSTLTPEDRDIVDDAWRILRKRSK